MAEWWKTGIIYQIYPRSFQDSDGDGIGDLNGIRRRLPYLAELGVQAVWISPIFVSPMADFGYDIADYTGIEPMFGTMADFEALVAEAHGLGLKIILDLVPNHTSDQHDWFRESRSSRENPKRDWYIWRDGRDGGPPNNWISNFGGSAWAWDEATGQYYYHAFLAGQPDLNWRNPEVRAAMHDVLRFWLDRGVDGFRVDVIWHLMKDPDLRDNPENPAYMPNQPDISRLLQEHSADHPDVHDVIVELRRVVDEYDERVLIGEIYLPLDRLMAYYGRDLDETHLPFNFQLLQTAWNARDVARVVEEYEAALPPGGWPNWVLGNHDQPRIAARVGEEQARVAAMLLLTLRGTPTMYYGDEIGIGRVAIPPDRVQDPWEKNEAGLGFGRDPQRTPMQWDRSAHAGFSTAEPWLPLAEDWPMRNVAALSGNQQGILSLYRTLVRLRQEHPALVLGSYEAVTVTDQVLVFARTAGDERLVVALNFSGQRQTVTLPQAGLTPLCSTASMPLQPFGSAELTLEPNEGLILA
ncbi:alpha-amylase family glycosyl hydrolase [Terrihabitans rhizophilus]|uniref:Alpha-amylase family glycosyl hydrolase n=1 Tax=Terrihabitans rhizophilus TaxID=3092662 RepID=A0ABU4RR30_9HYPH|nr:alpha-amylase family glycosyl hydrolase [Terrihabitans sp. PJ23]MDX6807305.1 alpha-amylase family glycosyl hydrolase [Terrihabitans sp. PJ23]